MKGLNKRILATAIAAVMLMTSVPVTEMTAKAEENPALIPGADYIITSKSSGKVLDVEGDSTEEGAKIVQMTADDSDDFQIWTVTDGGDGYYNLINKVSGKGIDVPNSSKKSGKELEQHPNASNRQYQKFIITGTDDGYYRITPKNVTEFAIRVKDDSREDGATLVQQMAEGADCEKWSFQLIKPDYAISDYEAVARQAYDSWLAKFFYVDEEGRGHLNNMNGYWTEFEVLEMFVDAYEHFGDEKYLTAAEQLYEGLVDKRNTNWSWNGYTDDTMYMTIATIRLYMVTGDPKQLNVAKRNFDMVYARAVQEDGAMIWCMDADKQHKNACANCPTMIAAVYMGMATGDSSYYDKAAQIWDWTYPNLFEEQYKKTGGYDDTGIQGIFIGSSALLYSVTGDQKYKDAALRGCEVAKTLGKGANEILDGEGVKGGDYNSVAAKGILARWLGYFTELCPEINQFDYWMEINADSAWAHRNSDDIMWGHFGTQTMENVENCEEYYESGDNVQKKQYASWACSAAVSWLINCTGLPVVRDGSENATRIEAENAVISGGATVENAPACSNGTCVGNIGVNNGSVCFTFKSDDAGKALLSLYYDANDAGKFNVTINGENTYTVDCPPADDGEYGSVPACLSVDFVVGENTVFIAGVKGETSPKLDYVGVNLSAYVEMEAGFRANGARTGNNASCSGGRALEWVGGEKGGSIAFMIPAEMDGTAKLAFPYATNGNRKVDVIVNGTSHEIECKSTKSWDVFSSEPIILDIDLQKGANEIIFTGVETQSAPNLDMLELEWPYHQAEIADEDSIVTVDTDVIKNIEDKKAADAVIADFESVSGKDITLEDGETIKELRNKYDALTPEQQRLIPEEKLAILTSAEAKLKELQDAADKAAADKEAAEKKAAEKKVADKKVADEVTEAISKIGTVTPEDEAIIAEARDAYNKLSEEQKQLVTNYQVLETAENELAKQKAEDDDEDDDDKEDDEDDQEVAEGDIFTYKNMEYEVTDDDMTGEGTVAVIGLKKKTKTSVTIPATVKLKDATFKVTSISKNAFKKCTKLKKVTIGKNVTTIGKYAFSGCSKLKTIKIKTKNLKSVGKNAFKGIHKNARIKVPSSKFKKYKSLLKKKGQGAKVTIKKY